MLLKVRLPSSASVWVWGCWGGYGCSGCCRMCAWYLPPCLDFRALDTVVQLQLISDFTALRQLICCCLQTLATSVWRSVAGQEAMEVCPVWSVVGMRLNLGCFKNSILHPAMSQNFSVILSKLTTCYLNRTDVILLKFTFRLQPGLHLLQQVSCSVGYWLFRGYVVLYCHQNYKILHVAQLRLLFHALLCFHPSYMSTWHKI